MSATNGWGRVHWPAVGLFVVLDVATYLLVYWAFMPAIAPLLNAVTPVVATAVGWVVSALRLTWIGLIAIRSLRRRRGLGDRTEAISTVVVAGVVAFALELSFAAGIGAIIGETVWSPRVLFDFAQWVGYPLLALLFVTPGPPERSVPRFGLALDRRGNADG